MAIPRSVLQFAQKRFNTGSGFWYFTKAKALKPESIIEIVDYHQKLQTIVIAPGRIWDRDTQDIFSHAVANRPATSAWARELKIFFGVLGTAWVEANKHVALTEAGQALLHATNPIKTLEQQVRKYQIGNPSLKSNVQGIELLPHHALIKLLLRLQSPHITHEEFVAFVSHIRDSDQDLEYVRRIIELYRKMSASDKSAFLAQLDSHKWQLIMRIWPYISNFLTFPAYLRYSDARIEIVDHAEVVRVLKWYESGNSEYVEFHTEKDWFSHYGIISSEPTASEAIQYYRSRGDLQRARIAFKRAIQRGHIAPHETEMDFSCRIEGEAALEDWLEGNLEQLEQGLTLIGRQYETPDAGRLDILAKDVGGQYVVVELKRDLANDTALGQLLRYMGWVRVNLSEGNEVRGYVVGEEFDDRMVYATLANDALDRVCQLVKYSKMGIRLEVRRTKKNCSAKVVNL